GVVERAEGGLVEDALAGLVAAVCSSRVADFAGLFEDRRESGRGREPVGCREAADATCLGDELGGEGRPHPGRAGGEGGGGGAGGGGGGAAPGSGRGGRPAARGRRAPRRPVRARTRPPVARPAARAAGPWRPRAPARQARRCAVGAAVRP